MEFDNADYAAKFKYLHEWCEHLQGVVTDYGNHINTLNHEITALKQRLDKNNL